MSERLRVAVVGAGVGDLHLRGYRALPDLFEVVALCDVDRSRAARVAEEHRVPRVLEDYRDLLRLDGLDVIDLCTPPHLHFEQARAALESGRHVVCEKPLVSSLARVDALARIEAASGRRLMPVLQYRFGAGVQKLKHLVEAGIAGRAYLTTVETAWLRGSDYYAVDWRGRFETEFGGVLLSHASHAHDLLGYVLGPVKSVFARTATRVNPVETEDCACASVELADGSLATLSATLGSHVEISRLRFCFEHLTAESVLAPYTPTFDPWSFGAASPEVATRIEEALRDFDAGPQWFPGQFARFHAALAGGRELPVTLADARTSLELATAMYHSARTGRPEELPIGVDHPLYGGWLPGRAARGAES